MSLATKASFVTAAYALDEASGSAIDEIQPGTNDLAENGTGGVGTATGMFATARDFESTDSDFFSHADDAAFSAGDINFMARCWVKLESKPGTMTIMGKGDLVDTANDEWHIYYSGGSDRFAFRVCSSGGTQTDVIDSHLGSPSTATWYLIHAWHDPVANIIGISINAGTADTTAHSAGIRDGLGIFALGCNKPSGVGDRFYDGLIDDAIVMKDNFLDATERTEDYNSGTGKAFSTWAAAKTPAFVLFLQGIHQRV